jgi:bifunctional UDP-N-acetylglucosamine pyrophosphorylase/glucosamine-1-phosphate N-acetyltransferase
MKAVVVLAAGHGTRMNSVLPKVLHEVGGKPMLQWVLDAVKVLDPDQVIVVTSPTLATEDFLKDLEVVIQEVPKGTGDALRLANKKLRDDINEVFLVCGDTPFLCGDDLKKLLNRQHDLVAMGMQIEDLTKSYGRIIFDESKKPIKIVETKHNQAVKSNPIANAGVYKFKKSMLAKLLPNLQTNKESNEIYVTDLLELAFKNNFSTNVVLGLEENFIGVNTAHELQNVEKIFQSRMLHKFIENGVSFKAGETCVFNHDTDIAKGAKIDSYVIFGKNVVIKKNAHILSFCYLSDCVVDEGASIGPFAHLRGKAIIGENASIGNFVEVKGSTIGKASKAKHLSYIGDAFVGEKTNIGAGTITCNYNGFEKFKTTIGQNVMIGANTTLIAPVNIANDAYVAAGSVISKDVAANSLAIARAEQKEKSNWTLSFRTKYQKH